MAPLMGWVKRLADQVIQDRLGEPDLEFAWAEGRPSMFCRIRLPL
jgi:hypothetical protein